MERLILVAAQQGRDKNGVYSVFIGASRVNPVAGFLRFVS
jgi:hypothetical protein